MGIYQTDDVNVVGSISPPFAYNNNEQPKTLVMCFCINVPKM